MPVVKKRYVETPIERPYVILLASLFIMMLAFFSILMAMGTPSPERQRLAWGSLLGTFGNVPGGHRGSVAPGVLNGIGQRITTAEMDELALALSDMMHSANLKGQVDVFLRDGALVIRLPDESLFAENSDALLPGADAVLGEVVHNLQDTTDQITIQGHTDSRSPLPSQCQSRWMFAAARAERVHGFLLASGLAPSRLRVESRGATVPHMPNETDYQRSQNRRIEIVVQGGADNPNLRPRVTTVEIGGIEVQLMEDHAASAEAADVSSTEAAAAPPAVGG